MGKFFTFSQNNSGGGFDHDEKAGIGHYVIVEAKDAEDANRRAESIGLYFNGVSDDRDCECCGDRWYEQSNDEGSDSPMIYDQDVSSGQYMPSWLAWGLDSYIHYMDGRIEVVKELNPKNKDNYENRTANN